jgi:hypothetical protein
MALSSPDIEGKNNFVPRASRRYSQRTNRGKANGRSFPTTLKGFACSGRQALKNIFRKTCLQKRLYWASKIRYSNHAPKINLEISANSVDTLKPKKQTSPFSKKI